MDSLIEVMLELHRNPRTFKSDFAREHASDIAEGASRGFLTCTQYGKNTGRWMVTSLGLSILEKTE